MPNSQWHNFVLVVKRALKTPVSVGLLTIGALFALATPNWLGLLIFGCCVAGTLIYSLTKLHDETFIRTAIRDDISRRHSQDATARTFRIEELDVESRVRMKAIVRLQNEISEDVASSPIDERAAGLAETVEQTENLVDRALVLAQQKRELQRYLTRTDESSITSRLESLQGKLESEIDPARRSEIEISIAAKQQELKDYQAIKLAGARIISQLEAIECSFSSLRARLVRIKSTDIKDWVSANEELKIEFGGLNKSVDTLEQSINEAVQF